MPYDLRDLRQLEHINLHSLIFFKYSFSFSYWQNGSNETCILYWNGINGNFHSQWNVSTKTKIVSNAKFWHLRWRWQKSWWIFGIDYWTMFRKGRYLWSVAHAQKDTVYMRNNIWYVKMVTLKTEDENYKTLF